MDKKVAIIAVGVSVNVLVLIHQNRKIEQIRNSLLSHMEVVTEYMDMDIQRSMDAAFEDIVHVLCHYFHV